jgi:hypothetical protein
MGFFVDLWAGIEELGGAFLGFNPHTSLDGTGWESGLHNVGGSFANIYNHH